MRAEALVRISEGETAEDLAESLGVTGRSIYRWLGRSNARTDRSLERVADGALALGVQES